MRKPAHQSVNDANCPREYRKNYWQYTSRQTPWLAIWGGAAVLMSFAYAVFMPTGF